MSSLLNTYKKYGKKIANISAATLLVTVALSATGCNTTQGFKPTASVMVGANTSL
ncbi:hypothetical protein I6E61_04560 [Psychrobacter sp. NZS113]|jgi:hypothetical protein|uniref:hypothetical protein n=1 Tax=Psychrobacter sp. NZS113 TaxID=2792045 RepID=UPI0018CEA843|nr:hypothetical protein [Psychrobacter sp. NZS113]MBH0095656.1 hypothetical protein [Psychrobacter sp. NZS113]